MLLSDDDAARVAAALSAARTESTLTVYSHAWRQWERWCTDRGLPSLPGDPAALCAYLAELAAHGIAVATLNVACSAIGHVHRTQGLDDPVAHPGVRQVRLGLRRTYGIAPAGRRVRWRSPRSAGFSPRSQPFWITCQRD